MNELEALEWSDMESNLIIWSEMNGSINTGMQWLMHTWIEEILIAIINGWMNSSWMNELMNAQHTD